MLRIAFVVPSLAPLGPVIVVRNLVERMVAHGHECVVFYFDERKNGMEFACETRRISFWKMTDFSSFDWVHAHSFRPMVYASRLKGVRKLVTMHSYLFTEYHYSLGRVVGYLMGQYTMAVARKFDKVVALSEDAKAYYSKWIPVEKLRVCYNGVDVSKEPSETIKTSLAQDWQRVEEFKGDSILIGCICELVKIKNLDVMLQAMALLPLEYKLLLIGSGADEKALKNQADQLGINDRVLFLGYRYEAHRLLPLVDIYAMTSRSEGFCLALVEAAMYGRRIVCADIPGMREKFSEEEVTYFDVDSPQELAEAVLTANEHPEKGERAKAVAEERFSTERMYEGYEGVYARKV
jgi:glycosyltransferase involved in cell wall biosynthesis